VISSVCYLYSNKLYYNHAERSLSENLTEPCLFQTICQAMCAHVQMRTFISTQPGHPFVGRRNEHQPKGGDALQLGSKDRYGSCVSCVGGR